MLRFGSLGAIQGWQEVMHFQVLVIRWEAVKRMA